MQPAFTSNVIKVSIMSLLKTIGWLLPVIFLAGCDGAYQKTPEKTPAKTVSHGIALPALPVIQGAVAALMPTVNGQRNDLMMSQVCALARGESTQEQVNQVLQQQGIDLRNIPNQGHPLSLLVNSDPSQRITACAAYIATSVMTLPKTSEFMVMTETNISKTKKANTLDIDPAKLEHFLRLQLTIAKADADIFALIATELEKSPGLTLAQYKQNAQKLFIIIAPTYLQRVKELYSSEQDIQFKLLAYSDSEFQFTSNNGYLFSYGYDGLSLSYDRIPWYSAGMLLGKTYLLDVAYFDPVLIKAIESEQSKNTPVATKVQ
ncbi:hypothetical protein [Rouxiella sp. Mn2063]|uniref:hypothetical protein n=1 Tax=Rouxiella sp. Mn2063 TaxID=3395262 RepID=UPI003BBD3159